MKLIRKKQLHTTKRCPECFYELPLNAKECISCHSRVGSVGADGRAKRPSDWVSYVLCVVSWAVFIFYIWWAFLRS
ncbi:MAG: hypothetical protein COX20_02510 [Desulfobacterales bacterium CG23_combo_of_CG06-09_8_20_14_all_52_9]|nr:MAG: hypothetical protein COX20_02510 [Desulfobacterales bacterium CG23_combo_of_CG06-09_8_20_14_all_52_9]